MNLIVNATVILLVAFGASWIVITGWLSYGCRAAFGFYPVFTDGLKKIEILNPA